MKQKMRKLCQTHINLMMFVPKGTLSGKVQQYLVTDSK